MGFNTRTRAIRVTRQILNCRDFYRMRTMRQKNSVERAGLFQIGFVLLWGGGGGGISGDVSYKGYINQSIPRPVSLQYYGG